MKIDILSLFPDYFNGPFGVSMVKRAREKGLVEINLVDIRDFAEGKHRTVDDRPYGGGPGMVLMAEPLLRAIRAHKKEGSYVIYLSPQGKPLNASLCRELSLCDHLIIICGHYEGIDQRVIDLEVDLEVSIGDFVLTSGLPAAAALLDATIRFIPGVIGHEEAARQDSFEDGLLDCPHYTRPPEVEGLTVPKVLLNGHHQMIGEWRDSKRKEATLTKRPDLS